MNIVDMGKWIHPISSLGSVANETGDTESICEATSCILISDSRSMSITFPNLTSVSMPQAASTESDVNHPETARRTMPKPD